ncbi:hypothetical protein AC41_3502 [Escherichia coli 2-011-08_S3_C3]|nr:hypothetical protein HMPREF9543_01405 [Escherichia coli MS 146-1]ENB19900.1 hypothetical protein ECBCE011MS01_3322 [Escherichia coli BCE011_MS-01]KDA83443.1 hypothetical protein AC41_3502 [Escherichia coli 2-011-08_S3_C3]KDW79273.1 hypothetical protein AC65_1128 [Escherichia coli 2-005-03_S4_C1]KDX22075.1 hypothetical protein AC45_0441 [Escherichia coli 2-210-07_S3_C3]KEM70950.1 hypothetical protein AB95_3593 [Escherichia coli 7-233-03_S3_C1]KEN01247.1 hypothetical protein AC53_3469 [Esche
MPDAMLAHLIRPAGCVAGVGRIRRASIASGNCTAPLADAAINPVA